MLSSALSSFCKIYHRPTQSEPRDMNSTPHTVDSGQQWIANARFQDIDEQAAQLRGYGQHYEQLGRGRFEGRFASYYPCDRVSIHFERINRTLAQSGRSPTERYSACFLSADSPPCFLDSAALSTDHLMIWPPGHSFEGVTPAGMEICVVSLACDLVTGLEQAELSARLVSDPRAVQRLRKFVDEGLAEIRRHTSALNHSAATDQFAVTLGSLLPIGVSHHDMRYGNDVSMARKRRLFRRAREVIHDRLSGGVSPASVCSTVGVSRRSLDYLFDAMLGTTPARYIRALQLNAIRRALLAEENAGVSIGDIVARFGIWHWSRFSAEYRRMFDELPSQTRRKHSADT
jgi:AraC family transcriptional regulator, ethanolamine operon transcriptional activator